MIHRFFRRKHKPHKHKIQYHELKRLVAGYKPCACGRDEPVDKSNHFIHPCPRGQRKTTNLETYD